MYIYIYIYIYIYKQKKSYILTCIHDVLHNFDISHDFDISQRAVIVRLPAPAMTSSAVTNATRASSNQTA